MSDAFVVLLRVHLHLPLARSLKAKRSELQPAKAWLRQRMGATVAEVGHHDAWQRSTLAVAWCGDSAARCDQAADSMCRYLEQRFPEAVRVERTLASWSDLEAIV